jgi:hypothetical protein
MVWPTVEFNGQQYRQREGIMLLPIEANGAAIVMIKDDGPAVAGGFTSVEQGPPGLSPAFAEAVNVIPLAYGDPTPDSASLSIIAPPSSESGGLYKWNVTSRSGPPGEDGKSVWDPKDLNATPVAGQIPVVNSAANGFELQPQKIAEVFYPGAINNIGSGNVNATLCPIDIPARPFARRIRAVGSTVVTGEAPDVRVDLVARLNGESGGNIVGRCVGIAQTERLTLSPGKPIEAGTSSANYDVLPANTASIAYIKTERKAGTSTYTVTAANSQFYIEATPLP